MMTEIVRRVILCGILILCLLLNGCGGGGGGGGGSNESSSDNGGNDQFSGWGTADAITDGSGSAHSPQIAMDADGNATAVWSQYDGTVHNIWTNRYNATTSSWETAEKIENISGNAYSAQVAMDSTGNAIVVWQQDDGTVYNLWANRYDATTLSWGTAEEIESNSGSAYSAQLAMDGAGNVMVVWRQSGDSAVNIWANRYSATTISWGTAEQIDGSSVGTAYIPQIAMDSAGNAIVVWQHEDAIWGNRYNATTSSWGTADLISTDGESANSPKIAMNSVGNAILVWLQSDGTVERLWSNRYNGTSSVWGTAEKIENNSESASYPQIVMDGGGNGIVVWLQSDGTVERLWSNRYNATSSTWGAAEKIENNSESAYYPQLAMDGEGNTIAVWQQSDGTVDNIWSNVYSIATSSWGDADTVRISNQAAYAPQIAINSDGKAIVIWRQSDSTVDNLWVSHSE